MRITIAGAGAMGSRFGLMLHKGGNEVTLIDGWPEHVKAIKEHGLHANYNGEELTAHLSVELQSEISSKEKTDLIIKDLDIERWKNLPGEKLSGGLQRLATRY